MSTFDERRALLRSGLSPNAKLVVQLILDTQRLEDRACTMAVGTIAAETGMARATAYRALAEAVAAGVVSEAPRKGRPTARRADVAPLRRETPTCPDSETPSVNGGVSPADIKGVPTARRPQNANLSRQRDTPCPDSETGGVPRVRHKRREREERERGEMSPPTGPPAREESQPSESEQIAALEARYPAGLMGRVREACELHRKRGRMADGVWLRSLRAADKHPLPRVVTASRTFLDKHPDGTRDERYWLGIVRNTGPDELRQRHIRGMAPVGTDWTRAREEMLALGIAEAAE